METDRKMSLGSMLRVLARRWPIMLGIALVLGIAAGGYTAAKQWPATKAPAAQDTGEEKADGQAPRTDYNKNVADIKRQIQLKSAYLNENIIARINPYAEGRAVVDFTVSTPGIEQQLNQEGITLGVAEETGTDTTAATPQASLAGTVTREEWNAMQICRAYAQLIDTKLDFTALAEKYDTKPAYLAEVVYAKPVETNPFQQQLIVQYIDTEGAADIMAVVREQMAAAHDDIAKRYGEHTLRFENESVFVTSDPNIFSWLYRQTQEMTGMINNSNSLATGANAGGISTGAAKVTTLSKRTVLKAAAKKGALGFAAGIVLYLLLGIVYLLLSGKILSAEEANRAFGLNDIGTLQGGAHAAGAAVAMAYVEQLASGAQRLALVGDLKQEELAHWAAVLAAAAPEGAACALVPIGDLRQDVSALKALRGADKVLFVTALGKSKYARAEQLLRIAGIYHKEVIGNLSVA